METAKSPEIASSLLSILLQYRWKDCCGECYSKCSRKVPSNEHVDCILQSSTMAQTMLMISMLTIQERWTEARGIKFKKS